MEKELSKLINNAFTFLEKAIHQFQFEPQFSVVNFCVAIELLLKARLMHEHWSLIVVPNHHPNITQFKSGNFRSLNFSDLIPRIEAVTGEKVPTDAADFFRRIGDHRNKILHFYHDAHTGRLGSKMVEEIAKEQCSAWFYLRRLLENWNVVFKSYQDRIDAVNASMKEHKIFLSVVYDRIKPEIDKSKKIGSKFRKCKSCEFKSSEEQQLTDFLFNTKCRVCLFEDAYLKLECENETCTGVIELNYDCDDRVCKKCGVELTSERIEELIHTGSFDEDSITINCGLCDTAGEVIPHKEYYICTNCFAIEEDYQVCHWCSEGQIYADLEFSGYEGCGFCGGRKEWDDD